MKKFITGFLVGAMLFSIAPVSAAIEEYLCYKADYKVMINGEEYISEELPILNYKGNTYAPFKSVLEKAGLNVAWNAELGQAEVTSNPTSVQFNIEEENTVTATTTITIEYDSTTKLPVGAEFVEYKGCKDAVKYNGNIYLSIADLSGKFGIKYLNMDVKAHTETFTKENTNIIVDTKVPGNRFLNSTGRAFYNTNLFSNVIGE